MNDENLEACILSCRRQHADLRSMLARVPSIEPLDERPIVELLYELRTMLNAHLKLEDALLYPWLEHSADAVLSRKAARYRGHMGSIALAFSEFYDLWSVPGAIAAAPARFLEAWDALRESIRLRMDSEDEDLYLKAEQVLASDRNVLRGSPGER